MRRIGRKLKSENGVSILLALLFFLVCIMVGASVLMAAASNAGKTRSNKQEEQAYLALSSALKLVTDDLTAAPYYGKYQYEETPGSGSGGSGGGTKKTVTQKTGEWDSELGEAFLLKKYDGKFAQYIETEKPKDQESIGTDEWEFKTLEGPEVEPASDPVELSVKPDLEGLSGFEVTITMVIREENYDIDLKASLSAVPPEYGDLVKYKNYVINAELTPISNRPEITAWNKEESESKSTPLQLKLGWVTGPTYEE